MEGVRRGEVKSLRVLETTARTSGIPPGGRWWNQAFLASWQGSYDIKNYSRNTMYLYSITAPSYRSALINSQTIAMDGGRWSGPQLAIYSDASLSNQIDTWASDDNWTDKTSTTLRGSLTIPAGQTRYFLLTANIGTPSDFATVRVKHQFLSEAVLIVTQ